MTRRRAAVYKRISADREGRELGVGRQHEDLVSLADRLGVVIVADYEDNDVSASTRSRKPRPGYDRMLADARAGQFEVIMAYTSGRLTRRPREHEDLIDLAERHGIEFQYVRSPSFDLTTAQGRRIARTLAAQDAGEAEEIGERVQRAVRQRVEQGEFHGGQKPFGIDSPEHADWVNEAIRRLLAGETLYGICVDWNKRGRPTRQGKKWRTPTLRRALLNPAVVGLREYSGKLYPAPWAAIVDRAVWDRLVPLLTDPRRRPNRGAPGKYVLSGLVFCALCEGRVSATYQDKHGGQSFQCSPTTNGCGGVRIAMRWLEKYVTEQVFAVADTSALAADMTSDDATAVDHDMRKAIDNDVRRLERLSDEYDDDLIERDEYRRRRSRLEDRIRSNTAALDAMIRSRARTAVPSGDVLRREWPRRDNVWKQTILRALIDRIMICQHPKGVTTALSRRRGESDEEFAHRRDQHMAEVLRHRVSILWLH